MVGRGWGLSLYGGTSLLPSPTGLGKSNLDTEYLCDITTVVPVFSGLCDQGTPAVSGQYNDVRDDFQYKLTRDQGTPANADADRHLFVIFAPQPGDSALFILFFITLGRKRYQISLLMHIISLKRMSNRLPQLRTPNNNDASRRWASWEK